MNQETLSLKESLIEMGYPLKDSLKISWVYNIRGFDAAVHWFRSSYQWSDEDMADSMSGELAEDIKEWEDSSKFPKIQIIIN